MAPPSQGCTDAVGHFEAKVNIVAVGPPHRKGRRPQYAWNKLVKQINNNNNNNNNNKCYLARVISSA